MCIGQNLNYTLKTYICNFLALNFVTSLTECTLEDVVYKVNYISKIYLHEEN